MKHPLSVTVLLVAMFLAAQIVGLGITERYINRGATAQSGQVVYNAMPFGLEPPAVQESAGYLFILAGVLIGTGLVLLIVKFRKVGLWKLWFYLSATLALTVAFGAFVAQYVALAAAAVLSFFKVFRQNLIIHNLTELFLYGGLAAIFVPILNVLAAILLLLIISFYDMFAVWQSRHMVSMATFQANAKLFAGFFIPRTGAPQDQQLRTKRKGARTRAASPAKKLPALSRRSTAARGAAQGAPSFAILGGGDVAFPLLFAAVVQKGAGFVPQLLLIPLCAAASLLGLLYVSEKGKFYPAMPFLTAGTLVGYVLFLLVQHIV